MRLPMIAALSTGGAAVALLLTPTAASAGPPVAPVAHTHQTLSALSDGMGGYQESDEIDFTKKTFTIPAFGDRGTFKNKGNTLVLKIVHGSDAGCTFPGTYNPSTTRYEGTYRCTDGGGDIFAVTTDGSVPPN